MIVCVLDLRGVPCVMGGVETHCENLYPLLKKLRRSDSFTIIGRKAYLADPVSGIPGISDRVAGACAGTALRNDHKCALRRAVRPVRDACTVCSICMGIGPALISPRQNSWG